MNAHIYRSTGTNKLLLASFDKSVEALMCLPAIGRILQVTVYLESQDDPTKIIPLPNGCSVEQSGIVFRP